MITTTQMYWLVKLDDMRSMLKCVMGLPIAGAAIIFILGVVVLINSDDCSKEERQKLFEAFWSGFKWCMSLIAVAVVIHVAAAFIPSTKQMAAIIVVPKIANSEKVQTTGNKLYDLALEWMEALRPSKESGVK